MLTDRYRHFLNKIMFFYREVQMALILFLLNHQLPRRWRWTRTSKTQGKPAGNVWPVMWHPWHYSGHYNINTAIPKESEGSKWLKNKSALFKSTLINLFVSPRFSKSSLHVGQNWHEKVFFYFLCELCCFCYLPIGLHKFYTNTNVCER